MNRKTEKIMRAFDGVAGHYDQYMEDTEHAEAQREIAEFIARNSTGKVLDVASGTGIMLEPFEDGVGIDISPSLTREAKRKDDSKDFIVADAHHLPFKDGTFEVAVSCLAFPWVDDFEVVMEEMCRVAERVYIIEEEGTPSRKHIEIPPHLKGFFEEIERLEETVPIRFLNRHYRRMFQVDIDGSHEFVCWRCK